MAHVVLIQELSSEASLDLLARTRLGRLACSQGGQPYIVPVYFAYADHTLYGFTTVGKKVEWMRANPLVCVEVDEVVSPERWTSVLAFGRYEELPDAPEWRSARAFAHKLLQRSCVWWEPAYARTILGGAQRPRCRRPPGCRRSPRARPVGWRSFCGRSGARVGNEPAFAVSVLGGSLAPSSLWVPSEGRQ